MSSMVASSSSTSSSGPQAARACPGAAVERVDEHGAQHVGPAGHLAAAGRRSPARSTRPAGTPPNSPAKWASRAAPVGVVSSPAAGPRHRAPPASAGRRAGRARPAPARSAGRAPSAISPSPSAGGDATMLSGASWASSVAAQMRSTAVSTSLSSCRCSSAARRAPRARRRPCARRWRRRRRRPAARGRAAYSGDQFVEGREAGLVVDLERGSAAKPPRRTSSTCAEPRVDAGRRQRRAHDVVERRLDGRRVTSRSRAASGTPRRCRSAHSASSAAASMSPLTPFAHSR